MTDRLVGYPVGERGADGDGSTADGRHRLVRIREGDASGERAVAAWLAVEGDHLQTVIDLGTAPNGDLVVVLPTVPHPLGGLLAAPLRLAPAEAVTLLVPIAEAVGLLHARGVVHGSIAPDTVALTDTGAPVLLLARTARTRKALGEEAFPGAAAADRAALRTLAARCIPGQEAVLDALARDPGGAGVDALFGLADPVPIRLDRSMPERIPDGPPARLVLPQASPAVDRADAVGRMRRAAAAAAGAARASLRRVRRRVWVAAAASVGALVVALVLLPGGGVDARARGQGQGSAPTAAVQPAPTSSKATAAPSPSPSRTATVTDPVRAASALLAARAACLERSDPSCLDRVEVPGSPVDVLDRAALVAGVESVLPSGRPVLVRRAGATATIDVAGATVLLIHEPGGWRLRDVVARRRPPGR